MAVGDVYLSKQGFEKLKAELEYLKTTKRREIAKEIGEARSHGDISENAEYDAAKDAQGMNEKKIAELEDKLSRASILDDANISKDEILIGAKVALEDLEFGDKIEYSLVSELEADFATGKISVTSPVGKALLGHKKGEIVEISVPAGILKYKVLDITR